MSDDQVDKISHLSAEWIGDPRLTVEMGATTRFNRRWFVPLWLYERLSCEAATSKLLSWEEEV